VAGGVDAGFYLGFDNASLLAAISRPTVGNRQSEGVPMRTLYLAPNSGSEDLMDPPKKSLLGCFRQVKVMAIC
jgi:hypothetical protein